MSIKSIMHRVFSSLPLAWIVLTAIYTPLSFIAGGAATAHMPVISFIGLFVPIGFWSFILSMQGPALYIFPIVLLTIFGGEYILRKLNPKDNLKIAIVLMTLFLLTLAVDLLMYNEWLSMKIFLGGPIMNGF